MQVMCGSSLHVGRTAPVRCTARGPRGRLCRVMALHEPEAPTVSRREQLLAALSVAALAGVPPAGAAGAQPSYFSDEFTETPSGLRFLDIRWAARRRWCSSSVGRQGLTVHPPAGLVELVGHCPVSCN